MFEPGVPIEADFDSETLVRVDGPDNARVRIQWEDRFGAATRETGAPFIALAEPDGPTAVTLEAVGNEVRICGLGAPG